VGVTGNDSKELVFSDRLNLRICKNNDDQTMRHPDIMNRRVLLRHYLDVGVITLILQSNYI
jgi:hypothetical protein